MLKGEIWLSSWPTDPESKIRPVLIISNNFKNLNNRLLDINIVKLTSLQRSNGTIKTINSAEDIIITLKKQTIIKCGSIYTIEKKNLHKRIHTINNIELDNVNFCLRNALDL